MLNVNFKSSYKIFLNQLGLKLLGVVKNDENRRMCLAQHLQTIDRIQVTQQQDEEYIVENVY